MSFLKRWVSADDDACHYFVMLAIVAIMAAIDDMLCFCAFFKASLSIFVRFVFLLNTLRELLQERRV